MFLCILQETSILFWAEYVCCRSTVFTYLVTVIWLLEGFHARFFEVIFEAHPRSRPPRKNDVSRKGAEMNPKVCKTNGQLVGFTFL